MEMERTCANAIRVLAMDAVERAQSGHPGMPMGMADIAEVLWRHVLRINPANPLWSNRDRFVLSNGHGAMLLYAVLHLTGFNLSIEDLKQFRQLHSKTPGHPEYGETPGVDTTTGPLGQGLANAVGMAIAETRLAAEFNRPGFPIVDHFTYVFVGDGCLMEGLSHEVGSLAGTLQLGKLIVFWDDNGISIDGPVTGWFTEDTPARFEAYGWQVVRAVDGHSAEAIDDAIRIAHADTTRPTLICCKTIIGFGAPTLAGSAETHGAPLGAAEIAGARQQLGWAHAPFDIPSEIYAAWDRRAVGAELEDAWNSLFARYEQAYPMDAAEFLRRQGGYLPVHWEAETQAFIKRIQQESKTQATRKASLAAIEAYAQLLPELMGGSADLTPSNCTAWKASHIFSPTNRSGNYMEYGVREFGMSAIMNGMALHRGVLPFGGTFLTFSDYARNAIRLSALMKQRVIYVYTHDSIGLGEDGPTHQPIEHAAMLRMTPGLTVWRPCDATETAVAWCESIQHPGPSCLLLTRQNTAAEKRTDEQCLEIARGGYILWEPEAPVQAMVIATGSEVALAREAAISLANQGLAVRVVSMPSTTVFLQQPYAYQDHVLPPHIIARVAVEAGSPDGWYRFVGLAGRVLGLDHFGASAPADELFEAYGFTVQAVMAAIQSVVTLKI